MRRFSGPGRKGHQQPLRGEVWRDSLVSVGLGLVLAGCATRVPTGPTKFFTSWDGVDQQTAAVFKAVDTRLRSEPGPQRDLGGDALQVLLADGVGAASGGLEFQVRMLMPGRFEGRRIAPKDRTTASFAVTCSPDQPQPCVDRILDELRAQPARMRKMAARSPRA